MEMCGSKRARSKRRFPSVIVSRHLMLCLWKLLLFPSDRGSDITLLELTNQVAVLKSSAMDWKLKIDFKKLSLEDAHVWGSASIRSFSLVILSWWNKSVRRINSAVLSQKKSGKAFRKEKRRAFKVNCLLSLYFLGISWDGCVAGIAKWSECLRVFRVTSLFVTNSLNIHTPKLSPRRRKWTVLAKLSFSAITVTTAGETWKPNV